MGDRPDGEELGPLKARIGRLSLVFVAAVVLGVTSAVFAGAGQDRPPEEAAVGALAPEVVLEGFHGDVWRLSDHLETDGRPVVLNLWASWCPPCREEIPAISAFADDHPEVAVVGVAVDDRPEDAGRLAAELRPRYLVGMDQTGTLHSRYPSFGLPVTFVIGSDGRIVTQMEGIVDQARLEEALEGL